MPSSAKSSSRPRVSSSRGAVDAVEIDVEEVDFGAAVFVNQSEGGTGDVVLRGGLEAFGDALDQRRLAGAEIAAQDDHARALQRGRQLTAQRHGLFGGMRDVLV